jgi:drug/metabolite transporter (DMT)-like permease
VADERVLVSRRSWALFAAMGLIWGIPYLLIKVAVEDVSGPVIVLARTAVGSLVLLPVALRDRAGLAQVRRHWKPIVAFAGIEIIGPWILLSDAERRLSSSLTGLLVAATPVVAVVLNRLAGGAERVTPARGLGLAVGTGGVALLAVPGISGVGVWPVSEVLICAVCYTIAPMIAARKLGDVPPLPMTAACVSLAALVYVGPAIATWPHAMPSARVLGALAGLGLVCTATAFVLFFALIREVGSARSVVITYVNPAVAVAAGAVLLGESLTWTIAAGFALVLAGSVLATSTRRRQAASTEPAAATSTEPAALAPAPATTAGPVRAPG